ncbi:MAG: FAD-dependent oxidoreductase [Planctomycetota bacterium]|jgi:phytoene dehydrogenase-like protein|nr:FAD-dependent oxidoreductase [Planctomycetota bacterium]
MAFDAIVIGAGPSGLAAAARLAHFGIRVCLLEAHRRPGGLSSWHHVGGREISSGLHAFTNYRPDGRGGPLGRLLRQLRLKYSSLDLLPQGQSSIRFPSARLIFNNHPEFFRSQVAELFPGEIDGFDRFRRLVAETDEGEITLRQSSARDILTRHVRDPLLTDMLLCPVMFYGNPGGVGDGRDAERGAPDMDWLLFCVTWKCLFESGLAHPSAGMRPLWEMLAKRIREDGSEVRLGAKVEALLSDGRRVAAARLASGEEIAGKLFFSSAGAVETAVLLGEPPDRPAGGVSVAEGVALLSGPPPALGLDDTVVFYSFSDCFRYRRPDGLTDGESGVLCATGNYGLGSDTGCLKLTQIASYPAWNRLDSQAYAAAKLETATGMAGALARLGVSLAADAGGVRRRFGPFDDLFTPMTLRRYASHAEAALYGSPVKTRTGETSRENLFLIGADQGFQGIVGAMLSGVAMANRNCLRRSE